MWKLIGFSITVLFLAGCSSVTPGSTKPDGGWSEKAATGKPEFVRVLSSPAGQVKVELFGSRGDERFRCTKAQLSYAAMPDHVQQFSGFTTETPLYNGQLPFHVKDLNFDGTNDFRLVSESGPGRRVTFLVWLFDPVTGRYRRSSVLESLPTPQFDYARQQVLSSWTTVSNVRIEKVYRVNAGKFELVYHSEMVPLRPGVFRKHVTRRVNGQLRQERPVIQYLQQ